MAEPAGMRPKAATQKQKNAAQKRLTKSPLGRDDATLNPTPTIALRYSINSRGWKKLNYPPTQLYDGANGQADPLLDFETDSDTHFQCPQCGQRGSVPTAALERALSETPHVHISCSSCAHKFEPFADMQEAGLGSGANDENDALSAADTEAEAEAETEADTEAETASTIVPPLDDYWQQGDTTPDAPAGDAPTGDDTAEDAPTGDDTADNREGVPAAENDTAPESSLPSWMMAEAKPATETVSEEAAADADIIADLSPPLEAAEDAAEDEAAEEDAAEDEAAEDEAEAELDTETDTETDTDTDTDTDTEAEAEAETEAETVAPDEADAAHGEAPFEESDEVDALDADALLGTTDALNDPQAALDAPETDAPDMPDNMLDMAERLNIEEVPYSPPARSGPVGVINGILLLVVLLLTGLNSYVLLQDKPQIRDIFTAAPLATASINVQTADFERFSDADGDSVEIAVRFINSGEKAGIIGDFRIDLQDSARQTLVSWTVLSSGETVAPGQSRTVNSTLFGPPAGLAHVAIAYPLDK